MSENSSRSVLAVGASLALAAAAGADVVVYTQGFDGALGAEWSGVTTTEGVQGFSTLPAAAGGAGAFSGKMLRNTTSPGSVTQLTLAGLPTHTHLSLSFLLAVIDSWDGSTGSPSPDYFNVRVDGVTVFQETFAIASGVGSYSALAMSGAANVAGAVHPQLGFNTGSTYYYDDGWDLTFASDLQNIAHTASSVTIEFFASGGGWQGGTDESWGMDSLSVTAVQVIPLPPAAWVGLAGLGLAAGARRMMRRR